MKQPCVIRRSDDEWMELITSCRASGMTDKDWCLSRGIPESTFYNAITRLRRKACKIPARDARQATDLPAAPQEAVRINIIPDEVPAMVPPKASSPSYLDNSHMIEISAGSLRLRITNDADPELLVRILSGLGGRSC